MIFYDNTTISNGLVQQAWLAYKGNNRWPSSGTDKYNRILMIANRKIEELIDDGTQDWAFFWTEVDLDDPIVAGTQTYNFPNNRIKKVAEQVFIDDANGDQIATFDVIDPAKRDFYSADNSGKDVVFISNENPLTVTFISEIKTGDNIVGGTIRVPVYQQPTALAAASDEIPLTHPAWLVYEVAAELARNDPAKDDQFANLQGLANNNYIKMVTSNQAKGFGNPNRANVQQPRIT